VLSRSVVETQGHISESALKQKELIRASTLSHKKSNKFENNEMPKINNNSELINIKNNKITENKSVVKS
jgi:hypothetical protein